MAIAPPGRMTRAASLSLEHGERIEHMADHGMCNDRVEAGVWKVHRVHISHLECGTGFDTSFRGETFRCRDEGRTVDDARDMPCEARASRDRASHNARTASNLQDV